MCARDTEREREKKHIPVRRGHAVIPSPLLHPVKILGMHMHTPGVLPGQQGRDPNPSQPFRIWIPMH